MSREYLVVSAHTPLQTQPQLKAPPTKYQKILIDSNSNPDLQIVVGSRLVEPIHGPIWSRLELEIGVGVGNRCRVWGPICMQVSVRDCANSGSFNGAITCYSYCTCFEQVMSAIRTKSFKTFLTL